MGDAGLSFPRDRSTWCTRLSRRVSRRDFDWEEGWGWGDRDVLSEAVGKREVGSVGMVGLAYDSDGVGGRRVRLSKRFRVHEVKSVRGGVGSGDTAGNTIERMYGA